jgi:hypothetical protein
MTDDFGGDQTAERGVLVAQRLVELVDTLGEEFDSVHLANRLVADCLDLVGVDAGAVLLSNCDGAVDVAANSDEVARMMETALAETAEGRRLDELSEEALLSHGYSALYPFPLRRGEHTVGALYLFLADRPPLTESDRNLVAALAAAATTILLHHRELARAVNLGEQLKGALNSRISIERATGVLAEYGGIGMGAAFDAMRSYARSHRLKLSLVAGQVLARRLDPGQVVPAHQRR